MALKRRADIPRTPAARVQTRGVSLAKHRPDLEQHIRSVSGLLAAQSKAEGTWIWWSMLGGALDRLRETIDKIKPVKG